MENLFFTVLSLSGTASIVILLVLLARLVLRRTPKIFSYVLWAVVLLRLLCPVTLESVLSLAPTFQVKSSEANVLLAIDFSERKMTIDVGSVPVSRPKPAAPENLPSEPAAADPSVSPWTIVSIVWLAGAAVLLAYSAITLLLLRRKLIGAVPLAKEKRVWLADHIASPFVLGLFRPRIYLPSGLPQEERDYILLHERTHIRRGDHIFRMLAWLAVAIHWFNPLVWLAFHLAGKDMEMSCDEAVLRRMGRDIRADYSTSLLRLSVGGKLPVGPLAFGDGNPKSRVKNILRYRKPALWVVILAVVAVAVTGVALATSYQLPAELLASDSSEPNDPQLTETWLDFYHVEGISWDESSGIQLPEYPGVSFLWRPGEVSVTKEGATLFDGTETTLFSGMPIWNVFLCDLTGDGPRELCATVSFGSGMIDEHIIVYDYATQTEYTLWDRGNYDYVLSLENGQLQATKSEYQGQAVSVGTLVLNGDGQLEMADEVPVEAAPSENGKPKVTDAEAASDPVPAPVLEIDPIYTVNDLGTSVVITGLDCDYAWWYPSRSSAQSEAYLSIYEPQFFGEAFSAYYSAEIYYNPEEDPDLIQLFLSVAGPGYTYTNCQVNLATGVITELEVPNYESYPIDLSPQEILPIARALAQIFQDASDFYTVATDLPPEEGPLPFDRPMKLWFGSGAGGWCTILTLHPDGSFEGDYHDSDMGVSAKYVCQFHGQFGNITQASAASWSMTLEELVLDTGREVSEVWYEDGIRYTSSSPYGFDGQDGETLEPGAQFMFYTPDATGHAPGTELYGLYGTSDFWGWWPNRHAFQSASDTLGCYGLRNMETGYGFFDLYAWGLL